MEWPEYANEFLNISQENLMNFDDGTRTEATTLVRDLGILDISKRRHKKQKHLANWNFSRTNELNIKLAVSVAIGSLLGNAFALQAAKLGPWAPIASYIGGIALNFGLDHLATEQFSLLRRKQNLNDIYGMINRLQSQDRRSNEFVDAYYDAQKLWVQQVEGNHFTSLKIIYLLLLVIGLLMEFLASFVLSQTLTTGEDFLAKIVGAAMPPLLVLLASVLQSALIDQSKDAAEAVEQYEDMLAQLGAIEIENSKFRREESEDES
ncbi:hypothetical protein ACE1CD_05400 [Aerosakkonema sp. BLCC-F183]|uniref:hypothetical protein n=1 Tax=Aerosakkonema sp. BLCC-F183 TaxID=3342834 RepID=UPI0035B9AA5C